jgi:hypothetical protein
MERKVHSAFLAFYIRQESNQVLYMVKEKLSSMRLTSKYFLKPVWRHSLPSTLLPVDCTKLASYIIVFCSTNLGENVC